MRSLTTRLVPALAGLALAAAPAAAQHDATRERQGTEFEVEVERLARELVRKRQVTMALTRTLQSLQVALRNENVRQLQRAQFEARLEGVREQLAAIEADGERLRSQLTALCPDESKPEGWVGIAYGGDINWSREGSGPVVTRFLDVPSVTSVDPGSPAERAGLLSGDQILSIAGRDVRDGAIAISPLLKPGKKIAFRVRRGSDVKLFTVTVERRPDDFETQCGGWIDESIAAAFAPSPVRVFVRSREAAERAPEPRAPRVPGTVPVPPTPAVAPVPPTPPTPPTPELLPFGMYSASATVTFAGAQIAAMDADMAEALGAERGVLVLRSGRGTPAERSGLRGGDVVISVDGRATTTPMDFLRSVERAQSVRSVSLRVIRKRKLERVELGW